MIITRDVANIDSTQLGVSASLSSIVTGWANKTPSGPAVEVGLDLLRYDIKCFFLKNASATNPLNAVQLQATNIPAEQRQASDWETIDDTTFKFQAAGAAKSRIVGPGDSRRYWRFQASSTNGA